MPDVNGLRRYSHEPSTTTDEELTLFLEAAQIWLENAGVPRLTGNALYTLCVYMLATHWLDNKGIVSDTGHTDHTPLSVFSIMHQLRTSESEGSA
ncbi:MAG: phage gp6-like head-tail connector protein [Clostridia bacterium]|nr:phage gp6-like head-tail connector protein [Clostridia bacterium]